MLAAFGFTAALLEGLPLVGLIFTVSNRIGAAMWAHGERGNIHLLPSRLKAWLPDLEKRQHYVAAVKAGLAPTGSALKPKAE